MTLSATALTTVARAKEFLGLSDDSATLLADGLAIYCDATDATAATVQVTDTNIILVITGGTAAGTSTTSLTAGASDTLAELQVILEAVSGWTCDLIGPGTVLSDDLQRIPATSALGAAEELTLKYVDNSRLEFIIEGVSDRLETWLGRNILSQSYSEIYESPWSSGGLVLSQPEVTSVELLALETRSGFSVTYTGTGTNARIQVTATAVVMTSRLGATATTTTSTFASNATTAALVTAINLVTGWTATLIESLPSAYLVQVGPLNVKNAGVTLEAWNDYDGGYSTNNPSGILYLAEDGNRFPGDYYGQPSRTAGQANGRLRLDYTAGLASIPGDIELTVLEMVRDSWTSAGRDSGIKSERLGDYEYTLKSGADSATVGGWSEWQGRVAKWRRVMP